MIKREINIFLIVGSLTVLTDCVIYRSLLLSGLFEINTAKAIGFLAGSLFAYCANRFWTFGHKKHIDGTMFRFILLYASTLWANIVINSTILQLLNNSPWKLQIAFLFATAASATLNFIGMKWFAFKENLSKEAT